MVDERRVSHAATFLDGKDYIIHKVTRAGFTTSFVISASRSDKRVILVSPTKKIISDTMNGAADIVGIYGNSACEYNRRAIAKEPLLKHLPMSIPGKCDNCKYSDECCILDIERNPDAQMKSLTAAKFEAIMISDSERAQYLREIISDADIIMFDEAHTLITNDVPKLSHNNHLTDLFSKIERYPLLRSAIRKWLGLLNSSRDEINDLGEQVEFDPDNWLIRELTVPVCLTPDEQRKIWGELRDLAKKHKPLGVTEEEVLQLRDLIGILCHKTARLSYISHDDSGDLYVCGALGRMNSSIREFLKIYAKNAAVIFVSGTLFEPYPDFFKKVVGRDKILGVVDLPFEQSIFPDLQHTNRKMMIYADTNRLSGNTKQKYAKIPAIIDRIKEISEAKQNTRIHVIAPNVELHKRLSDALKEQYPNIFWDYYRSENTIGVKSDIRIIIAIGLAEVPKNAYDCLANSYTESQTIRIGSVDAATWQAWSRAKDPAGEVLSEVYCIGVRVEDVERVISWGPGRTVIKTGKYDYGVVCIEELPKPQVMAPYKKQVHAEQRKASPYIMTIWDANGDLSSVPFELMAYEFENPVLKIPKSTYNNIRGFGEMGDGIAPKKIRCFGAIYSNPQSWKQMNITIDTLEKFFRSNRTHHAEQQKQPDANGKWGYRPNITQDWTMLIMDMLGGLITPATYGVGEDGLTVQCAFDIDNHAGTNPARPRVLAIVSHLRSLGIQPIVTASGSDDSFHIYIPILQTSIKTCHDFIKAMLNEIKQAHADLDFKQDTEVFPKQQNIHRRAFGNALKLPLAINNKTGRRSELLDDTLEPIDVVLITQVVELQEPEKEAEKVGARSYLPQRSSHTLTRDTMRPCIVSAISKQLNGESGHNMRVAIGCEAFASGKSRDEIIDMYKSQDDFNPAVTSENVDYIISQGYRPWKCETLQDRCPDLVNCANCPRYRGTSTEDHSNSDILVETS